MKRWICLLAVLLYALNVQSQACSSLYGQCAGINWNGPRTCCPGSVCTFQNPYYSQCLASNNPPPQSPPPQSPSPSRPQSPSPPRVIVVSASPRVSVVVVVSPVVQTIIQTVIQTNRPAPNPNNPNAPNSPIIQVVARTQTILVTMIQQTELPDDGGGIRPTGVPTSPNLSVRINASNDPNLGQNFPTGTGLVASDVPNSKNTNDFPTFPIIITAVASLALAGLVIAGYVVYRKRKENQQLFKEYGTMRSAVSKFHKNGRLSISTSLNRLKKDNLNAVNPVVYKTSRNDNRHVEIEMTRRQTVGLSIDGIRLQELNRIYGLDRNYSTGTLQTEDSVGYHLSPVIEKESWNTNKLYQGSPPGSPPMHPPPAHPLPPIPTVSNHLSVNMGLASASNNFSPAISLQSTPRLDNYSPGRYLPDNSPVPRMISPQQQQRYNLNRNSSMLQAKIIEGMIIPETESYESYNHFNVHDTLPLHPESPSMNIDEYGHRRNGSNNDKVAWGGQYARYQ